MVARYARRHRQIRVVLLAQSFARPADCRVFMRTFYRASPARLALDPRGAVARHFGFTGRPQFAILDRRGKRVGPVRYSFVSARSALPS